MIFMPPNKTWGIMKSDRPSVCSCVRPFICSSVSLSVRSIFFFLKGMPFKLYIYLGAFVTYCDPILVFPSLIAVFALKKFQHLPRRASYLENLLARSDMSLPDTIYVKYRALIMPYIVSKRIKRIKKISMYVPPLFDPKH